MIFTVGHSNRTLADLLDLLRAHGVEKLVDVRSVPGSRRNPQFNREALAAELDYLHQPGLGGRRDDYEGYSKTPGFERELDRLLDVRGVVCIMCAEADPSNCHRRWIAEALTRRGVEVKHLGAPPQNLRLF